MQQRHLNRKQYFCELANTAQTFYMEYLNTYIKLTPDTRVLEIGCGEGGNLLPFAEKGCQVTGIDICQSRINEAQTFFTECHQQGTFICQNFTNETFFFTSNTSSNKMASLSLVFLPGRTHLEAISK